MHPYIIPPHHFRASGKVIHNRYLHTRYIISSLVEINKKKQMTPEERKQRPVYSGLIKYFPKAIMEVAHTSWKGNEQHQPGTPVHWDRNKSKDQLDACLRHIIDHASGQEKDKDGCYHLSKAIWRLCAELELILEKQNEL